MADAQSTSSSTSAFVSSLILYGIISIIFTGIFLNLRPKEQRVYQPRSLKDIYTVREEERTEEVPSGYFAWLPYLFSKPHSFLIQHTGLDGYLFLRFLSLFGGLSLVGCFLLFPILLPVNATNGYNLEGFELLGFSNVSNKNRFYAHVFLSWIFFGLIIYVIFRELYYYVSLRHAIQTSPLYDGLLSSRTVILTELSSDLSNEAEIQKRFQNADNVVFAHDTTKLQKLVEERAKSAKKLEGTINKVIKKSLKLRKKAEKKGNLEELIGNKPEDDLQTYIPQNKRPKHRLGKNFLPLIGSPKVDTLEYCDKQIGELNEKIKKKQEKWDTSDRIGACFIEFKSQLDAQRAYQSAKYILDKGSYDKCLIGAAPEDLVWANMGLSKKVRKSKRAISNTVLTLTIIFWAIPVAVVGCISNINFLTDKVHFLRFINNMPDPLMGIITGILPTVALAVLMSLVPPFIKKMGQIGGCMSRQEMELYCQSWYYAFQVIQVFLVVTAASSASSTVVAIINDPSSAMLLLAKNLPKASNFYIAYFLLQGLTIPAGSLAQFVNLILSKVLGKILDSTPRQKWTRYNTLSKPSWGVIYPVIQLLVCIYFCYSIIAPIILVFSTGSLILLYVAYLYNTNYVLGFSFDLRGRNYPMALFQAFVGLYLAEICLIGLFVMAKTWGPVVLEAVFLAFTALCHIYFKRRFLALFDAVPLSAIRYARGESGFAYPNKDQGLSEIKATGEQFKDDLEKNETGGVIQPATSNDLKRAGIISDDDEVDEDASDDKKRRPSSSINKSSLTNTNNNESNFVPENEEFHKFSYDDVKDLDTRPRGSKSVDANGAVVINADAGNVFSDANAITKNPAAFPPNENSPNGIVGRLKGFFNPSERYNFVVVRNRLPHVLNTTVKYEKDYASTAYTDPCVTDPEPTIWIGCDSIGLSKQQILLGKTAGVKISDDFAEFDDKGACTFTFHPPDIEPEAKK
ncbi:LAFE_0C08636g1_1 [Lachancea fermentati]|uniref:LAFE_0C08636g1_1 n=1 Tax=Lachancea fermentati TaxID=4955 RepID=A0A1G4MAA5_LACFM|nr:LAFE_0C08636g1_1 [Lachancea fermentati]